MQTVLDNFVAQSATWALIAVMLVAFLESLVLVGLVFPGAFMMIGLGALIGSGEIDFWQAWLAAMIGCLCGDWISFWLGRRFKNSLHRWSFIKRYRGLLDKTSWALHQHSMITVLGGRFIGPVRPLVPMVAGMLGLPVKKFLLPNIAGCLLWPPLYFMPGILAGAVTDIPADEYSASFKGLLLISTLLLCLAGWLCWRYWRGDKVDDRLSAYLPRARLQWLAPVTTIMAGGAIIAVLNHPLMPVYGAILRQVLSH
ncbi:DedA family protein [Enterobacteriaceae bacterium ESL0689]|nr:DedA family protein [Enterobacteriaceae bacterium ESL0689]